LSDPRFAAHTASIQPRTPADTQKWLLTIIPWLLRPHSTLQQQAGTAWLLLSDSYCLSLIHDSLLVVGCVLLTLSQCLASSFGVSQRRISSCYSYSAQTHRPTPIIAGARSSKGTTTLLFLCFLFLLDAQIYMCGVYVCSRLPPKSV